MPKKDISRIGGLISDFKLSSIIKTDVLDQLEKKIGTIRVSHIHIDVLDNDGKDIEDIVLIYRNNKERKENIATLLCDSPKTFDKVIEVIEEKC